MDRETIIKLARDAGMVRAGSSGQVIFNDELERFAKLVAAHVIKSAPDYKMGYADGVAIEREACAKVCHDASVPLPGELQSDAQWGALCLATAIRARGNT